METKPTVPEEGKKEDVVATKSAETSAAPAAVAEGAKPAVVTEDVPDPDEDDLDDLDDMLDEFSTVKIDGSAKQSAQTANTAPSESTPKPDDTPKAPATAGEEAVSEADFAQQLQAGMADLLGELEKSPEMQEQFEDMFKQMAAAAGEPATGADGSSSTKSGDKAGTDASFQETIRRTMERMQTSGEQATAAAAAGSGDDFMSELLKQMGSGDLGGEGGEEEFSKMLMGMMEQLTNKDILYEPMKELDDKFPEWFEKNKDSTPAEDLKRYEEQKDLVREIVAKFEETRYSDSNAADREYIVDRMQKMQAAGSPPSDLVGDMASAQEAFAGADDQCNPQ
ncbi:Peroxisome chaperone and import receptor [Conoideocrella luteorostrata]|uniref:Peroxisome chaperone and import receptor n=1 Tax=Conoideocrella luteorostrata TaxID=1105319 RepID=A0AAJ0CVL4_9HYPO|nr:Peroxisome chaperone and import receptor [Conoideocrella luteorostrata]